MSDLRSLTKSFLGFALIAGIGWLLDLLCFALLVKLSTVPPVLANMISSYVGVTFVWFASLRAVFKVGGLRNQLYLILYWGYQFLSISLYSWLIQYVAKALFDAEMWGLALSSMLLIAKIAVTPVNLVTNFIFMKYLTGFMKGDR